MLINFINRAEVPPFLRNDCALKAVFCFSIHKRISEVNVLQNRLKEGIILGERYRIIRVLGAGGMGSVYLAEDIKLQGKQWAVKEARQSNRSTKDFIEEAEALIQLNHPAVPNIIDYFPPDQDGYSYLVMDYVEGSSLQQVFDHSKHILSIQDILQWSVELCELFSYLHQLKPKPIIYRDLKPSNVMLNKQGNIKLIDFGTARMFKSGKNSDTIPMGSIGFAAPEQFDYGQTDHRTDIYNLGALLYYLLSKGQFFYQTQSPLSKHRPDIPVELEHIVDKCLMIQPDDRYQSAEELKLDMMQMLQESHELPPASQLKTITASKSKLIVIGNVYPESGSTFVAISLARIFNHYKLRNAVLECPGQNPQLYELLKGNLNLPEDDSHHSESGWKSGLTTWLPIDPNTEHTQLGNEKAIYKRLVQHHDSVMIVDVSSLWGDDEVRELCATADHILFVADPNPYMHDHQLINSSFATAMELKKAGKSVDFIANRHHTSRVMKEWMNSFPWKPVVKLPNIGYDKLTHSIWSQQLLQDNRDVLSMFTQAFWPWIHRHFPQIHISPKKTLNILKTLKNKVVK